MTMTREQETMVADRLAFELIPANGKVAWDAAELTEGIGEPADLESAGYKRVVAELDRLSIGIHANPVNALFFRLPDAGSVTDPEVAKRYLPRAGRPPAGIRVQQGADDPFAVLTARRSTLRAASALPRAAQKLADQVRTGTLSEATRDEIVQDARSKASDEINPEIESALRRMLPM